MPRNRLWRPAIEFNLTEHCNLRCTHCDHASSILPTRFADLESFTRDIAVLSTVLQAGELKFLGGEPLLHPRLVDFLKVAKDAGIANRLILVTNGVLLHKAPAELWELIDGMWISVYPGVKYRFDWEWVRRIADEHHIFVWRKETPTFTERSLIEEIKSDELVRMVYQNCDLAHFESCHTIYEGRYYFCSPSVWMEPRLALHGTTFKNREADSVAIHDNASLYEDLDNAIRSQEPLQACRFCLGSWARHTPNEQLTNKRTVEFLTRKPEALAELVDPELIVPRPLTDENAIG
jgi:organic radical activating enzyme